MEEISGFKVGSVRYQGYASQENIRLAMLGCCGADGSVRGAAHPSMGQLGASTFRTSRMNRMTKHACKYTTI
jgi:hypothetical protein